MQELLYLRQHGSQPQTLACPAAPERRWSLALERVQGWPPPVGRGREGKGEEVEEEEEWEERDEREEREERKERRGKEGRGGVRRERRKGGRERKVSTSAATSHDLHRTDSNLRMTIPSSNLMPQSLTPYSWWALQHTLCDSQPSSLQEEHKVLVEVREDGIISGELHQRAASLVGTDTAEVICQWDKWEEVA